MITELHIAVLEKVVSKEITGKEASTILGMRLNSLYVCVSNFRRTGKWPQVYDPDKKCLNCGAHIDISCHSLRIRCEPCAKIFREKPVGRLSDEQKEKAINLSKEGYNREEIAKELGVSKSNLHRSFKGKSLTKNVNSKIMNKPDLIIEVIDYYKEHSIKETENKFKEKLPDGGVYSVLSSYYWKRNSELNNRWISEERRELINLVGNKYKRKIHSWTTREMLELMKMKDIISYKGQIKFFKDRLGIESINTRGGLNITSLNLKKGLNGVNIGYYNKKWTPFIKDEAPSITNNLSSKHGKFVLWVDIEKNLVDDCPQEIVDSVKSLAKFQRSLFGVKDVRGKVLRMIREREISILSRLYSP